MQLLSAVSVAIAILSAASPVAGRPDRYLEYCNASNSSPNDCSQQWVPASDYDDLNETELLHSRAESMTFGVCYQLGHFNDRISWYKVQGMCCKFYEHNLCSESDFLFSANDRKDSLEGGNHDNKISSFMCFEAC